MKHKNLQSSNNKKSRTFRVLLFEASCRIRTNDPEITNHVLWPTELKRRVGKLTVSRRYDHLPLLRSSPGGFNRQPGRMGLTRMSLIVRFGCLHRLFLDCGCKGRHIF